MEEEKESGTQLKKKMLLRRKAGEVISLEGK